MFQRLKGALDRTIAEEQSRQRSLASNPTSSSSPNGRQRQASISRGGKSQSPAGRVRRKPGSQDITRDIANGDSSMNPDPSLFEAAFVLDDSEEPSRATTPKLPNDGSASNDSEKNEVAVSSGREMDGSDKQGDEGNPVVNETKTSTAAESLNKSEEVPTPELPPEIRARLRKLDKLEATYPGPPTDSHQTELLRSYRIAHSRAKSIEPFEKALRENTPLTSIKDPASLVEYLNQLNLKGDMYMGELKRVTAERDDIQKKSATQETELQALREELEHLKSIATLSPKPSSSTPDVSDSIQQSAPQRNVSAAEVSPSEDDNESSRGDEIEKLKNQVISLEAELSAARESSVGISTKLDQAIRDLKDSREASAASQDVETRVKSKEVEILSLSKQLEETQSRLAGLELSAKIEKRDLEAKVDTSNKHAEEFESKMKQLDSEKARLEQTVESLNTKIKSLEGERDTYGEKVTHLETQLKENSPRDLTTAPAASATEQTQTTSASKKKKNKKKKGGQGAAPSPATAVSPQDGTPSAVNTVANAEALATEIASLREEIAEKDRQIEALKVQKKGEETLKEEIEGLQENLLALGQDHVEVKEKMKDLTKEKALLLEKIASLEQDAKQVVANSEASSKMQHELASLQDEYNDLKEKSSALQTDLGAAQLLAQTRYKDLTELKEILQKAQPELKNLRHETSTLKATRDELEAKIAELKGLERKEKDAKAELSRAQRVAVDRENEIKSLRDKLSAETNSRVKLEDEKRAAGRNLRRAEAEKIEFSAREEKATRELQKIQEEVGQLRPRVKELEDQVEKLSKEKKQLQDDTKLKSQQYTNAQGLLGSMRDQTTELTVQLKESRSQAESLDEELAEVQKLLSERTRETETMRRMLSDVEQRTETKVRDMRARMEAAIEERDRMEDESSTLARRKTRETEELRQKVRDMEREVKSLTNERDDLDERERAWKRRREELESVEQKAEAEVSDMRNTVGDLRMALDASEKQVRDVEKQKTDLKRLLDELKTKYDKLSKDLKSAQVKLSASSSHVTSDRSSIDSSRSGLTAAGTTQSSPTDVLYMKTILLQFLEQKDAKLRSQLVPVLGKLLKFDQTDEKKWLAAVQHLGSR